jgi:hypothetical protein
LQFPRSSVVWRYRRRVSSSPGGPSGDSRPAGRVDHRASGAWPVRPEPDERPAPVSSGIRARVRPCPWQREMAPKPGDQAASPRDGPPVRRATRSASSRLPRTVRFSGRTCPQLAWIVRALCAVAGRCCSPLVAAVAVTVAVSCGRENGCLRVRPHGAGDGSRPVRAGSPMPRGFWPECP